MFPTEAQNEKSDRDCKENVEFHVAVTSGDRLLEDERKYRPVNPSNPGGIRVPEHLITG